MSDSCHACGGDTEPLCYACGEVDERARCVAILRRRAENAYVNTAAELLEAAKEIEGG